MFNICTKMLNKNIKIIKILTFFDDRFEFMKAFVFV